jgi:hypothetical protein
MSSGSTSDIVSALGLPSELLEQLNQVCVTRHHQCWHFAHLFQIGIDINCLVQEAEHSYIEQLIEFAQGLPSEIQIPVDVRDPSAFARFLGDAAHSYFSKCVLSSSPRILSN